MGEIADMMLDGTLCEGCGEYLGGDDGFPQYCHACKPSRSGGSSIQRPTKVACPDCGKMVKRAGVQDHQRDVHGGY